jgi:hypothetical protein
VIECYFVAIAQGSAVDQETNNLSVFSLVEVLQVAALPTSAEPVMLPIEGHAYIEQPTSQERRLDGRLLWINEGGETALAGEFLNLALANRRMRLRFRGLRLPPWGAGNLHLIAEWRETPGEGVWTRSGPAWPVEFLPPALSTTPSAPPLASAD